MILQNVQISLVYQGIGIRINNSPTKEIFTVANPSNGVVAVVRGNNSLIVSSPQELFDQLHAFLTSYTATQGEA